LALIPKFGIAGAAAATTLAYCLTLVVYLVLQQVINKQHWHNFILPTKVDLMRLRQFVKKGKT
jgi:Na+-driven multidrug efflux pump